MALTLVLPFLSFVLLLSMGRSGRGMKVELWDVNQVFEAQESDQETTESGFFTLDDLYVGKTMAIQFPVKKFPHFLPRNEAESIPFSISQLPSVLQLFSIPQHSPQFKAMESTLKQCESEPIRGETKLCVTSLESMLDFVRRIFMGSEAKLKILTTSFPRNATETGILQNYTVLEISNDIYAPKWVACHPLAYPYLVYYCHSENIGSKIFKVKLGGENGDEMEALGVCHLDTSDHHILFQLGMKPGEAPLCHFFPVKHLLWVPQLPSN